tara:strand:- start:3182 stop:3691 length:510 start_codon:yes stop_codon:yes gene_type:complete
MNKVKKLKKGRLNSALFSLNPEFFLLLFIYLFCIVTYMSSLYFDEVPAILVRGIQPATFPKGLIILIAFLNSILTYLYFTKKIVSNTILPALFYKTIFAFFVFVLISHFVDLFLALIFFSFLISYWWGEKNIILILSLSIVFPLLVFVLFETVLGLRFPAGILTNLYYN